MPNRIELEGRPLGKRNMLIGKMKIGSRMQIIVIGALLGVVAISTFQLIELRAQMFQDRQLKTEHLIDVAVDLLNHYHEREAAGKMSRADAQKAALAAIKAIRYGDGEYYWIQDFDGNMVMHPIKPELDGKPLLKFQDANGKTLFNDMQEIVKSRGAGFVDYMWPKPGSEKPLPKISFVKGFTPWGWIVGSGIYVDDVDAVFIKTAFIAVLVTLAIALATGGGAWLIGRGIAKPIAGIAGDMLRLANGDKSVKIKNIGLPNEIGDLSRAMQCFLEKTIEMERLHIREAEQKIRDRMEAELRNRQRLEALGTLAGGVAHEINTPLQYVSDNLRFLYSGFQGLLGLTDGIREDEAQRGNTDALARLDAAAQDADLDFLREEMPPTFEQTREGVAQISRIVQAIKEFSHPGGTEKVMVDLNAIIETALTVTKNQWKYAAKVETDLDPDLPLVPCLVDGVRQVMLNLIINAAHTVADKVGPRGEKGQGLITIRSRHENDRVVIEIADTGTGIPDAIADKVFDLFFTTKAPGQGTGQGLALCHTVVVQQHGGRLSFDSREGEGTCFRVELPLDSRAQTENMQMPDVGTDGPD